MMRLLLLISLFFVSTVAIAKPRLKPDSVNLKMAVTALNDAMVKKDSVVLGKVLHKRLSYGHSNGWIENKKEMIADLYNGKLTYNKIETTDEKIEVVRETATVRNTMNVDVLMDGKPMSFKLYVLQVWVWKKNEGWKLMGRQSVQAPK